MCNNRENLRNHYVTVYGPQTANKIRRLECLKTKRARLITSLNFLKRCRDNNIIPVCAQISPKKDIAGSAGILRQASKKLLIRCIRQHRFDADKINKTIETESRELKSILTDLDFQKCQDCTDQRAVNKYDQCKIRHVQKYNKLVSKASVPQPTRDVPEKTSVVNLVKQTTIDSTTLKALEHGLNYAITPKKVPYENIICSVENVLAQNNVKKEDLEAIRQDVSSILRHSKPPKPNLPRDQYLALNTLRKNPDVIVLRADKGNSTVIMDTAEYNLKIQELLSDENTYKLVKTDPTNKIVNKTKQLISKYSDSLELDVKALIPSCIKPPKLYGLPKIHKTGYPLRPIVSQIDSPTYKLAQHLAKFLSQLRGHTSTHVKDSYHFISQIEDLHLADEELMVSFDVQSLFTNLPLHDCIEIVKRKLNDYELPLEYAELLEHCLTSGYLYWDSKFYLQIDGVAMGSPVSPVVADIYMEDFEERALSTALAMPKIFKRYVDDTFAILSQNQLSAFLNHLNSINSKIQFTMEPESSNSLAFLDILIIRNPDNSLGHTVYRKPTHTDKYLNGNSHHHPCQLATVGKSLLQRARGICDGNHLEEELLHVKSVLRSNSLKLPRMHHRSRPKTPTVERLPAILPYIKGITDKVGNILKRASIKTYFKPHRKISQLLRPVKSNIPLQDAGMHFSQSVAIIQSQVGTIRGVQVLYSDQNPLSVDLVINMPQDGIRLIFDPVAQRLKVIEIYNMKLVKLRYSGMYFNSAEITPSIEQVEHCFGATHPGLYDSQRHLFALNFRGLSFYFPVDSKFEPGYAHGLGSLQFPNGGSPVVSRTTIYYGSQHQVQANSGGVCPAPLPELPLSCYRQQLHLRRCLVLRSATATIGLRLHVFTEGTTRSLDGSSSPRSVCRVVRFGDSAQRVCGALGAPARLYYKADDKMRIHRPTARRRPPPASDYFFNYFTLGLDILFDARTHQVKKFVLHTNYPGHYNFNMYHRCEFELTVQPDKCEPSSLVESRGSVCVTAYSKWETVSRALRVAERPVVLNRASSTNTTNPFGSTFCYGYQDMIFEVMSNNYIASITLYQPEGTRPHYTVNSIA